MHYTQPSWGAISCLTKLPGSLAAAVLVLLQEVGHLAGVTRVPAYQCWVKGEVKSVSGQARP